MLSKVWSAATLGIDAVRIVVEVDGRMFVDPNVDALKKIFHVDADATS